MKPHVILAKNTPLNTHYLNLDNAHLISFPKYITIPEPILFDMKKS